MKKSGQITLFILIGLVIVVGAIGATVMLNKPGISGGDVSTSIEFQAAVDQMSSNLQDCIDMSVREVINDYGFESSQQKEAWLEIKISEQVAGCFDSSYYEERGYTLDKKIVDSDVSISENSLIVELSYPIRVIGPDLRGDTILKEQTYVFPKAATFSLGKGKTNQAISPDKRMEMFISEGVIFKDPSDEEMSQVTIKLVDGVELLGFENPYMLGNAYDVSDSTPSEPVDVMISYDEKNLLPGQREEDIALAQYDQMRKVWFGIPSEVDTDKNIVKGKVSHFSSIALMTDTNINGANPDWTPSWFHWAGYFIEHIHRPCRPYSEGYYSTGHGAVELLAPESVERFSGVFDKDKTSHFYGEDNKFEERWYLNNFCNAGALPFDGEGEGPSAPEHCGVVYLPPQVNDILIRQPGPAGGESVSQTEYVYVGTTQLINSVGDSLGDFLGDTTVLAQDSQLLVEGVFSPESIYVTGGDRAGDEFNPAEWTDGSGENPLLRPDLWQAVSTGRPNEYAEMSKEDWDEDDKDNLDQKKCLGPQGYAVSCMICEGKACENVGSGDEYIGLVGEELADACFAKCKEKAAELYDGLDSWAPWEVSGDGILDFRWEGDSLKRTRPVCRLNTEDITYYNETLGETFLVNIEVIGVASCEIETKDVATPMYYGYSAYKAGAEEGYEGAGNNYHPVSNIYPLYSGETVLPSTIQAIVTCTLGDECHAQVNGKDIGVCAPVVTSSIFYDGIDMRALPPELTGDCRFSFSSKLLHGGDNTVTAWVVNKRTGEDVCAFVDVQISVMEGIGERKKYLNSTNSTTEAGNGVCPDFTFLWHGHCWANHGFGRKCLECLIRTDEPSECLDVCEEADFDNSWSSSPGEDCSGDVPLDGCCTWPDVCVPTTKCNSQTEGACFAGFVCCADGWCHDNGGQCMEPRLCPNEEIIGVCTQGATICCKIESCDPLWHCNEWGECEQGIQNCLDWNDCVLPGDRDTTRNCSPTQEEPPSEEPPSEEPPSEEIPPEEEPPSNNPPEEPPSQGKNP